MRNIKILILLFLTYFVYQNDAISSGAYVLSPTAYKYQVAVLCPVIMCSGAMITNQAILTTATCVNNLSPQAVNVYLGSNKYYDGGLQKPISYLIQHPSFDSSTLNYNIAVLGLAAPLSATDLSTYPIQPIPLATALPATNSYGLATGYGAEDPSLALPDTLKMSYFLLYSTAQCQQYKNNRLTSTMFCAGDPKGVKDLCPADQGAPLAYSGTLIGFYNWGCSCGLAAPNPSSPVFTNVVFLRNWINNQVNSFSK